MQNKVLTRCFPLKATTGFPVTLSANSQRIMRWLADAQYKPVQFSDIQTDAMSRLLPLLLCGEQSAQLVFNGEIQRLASEQQYSLVACLQDVEADEHRHDIALQHVALAVSQLPEFTLVQRKAKRFYAHLGRVSSYSEHFVRISILDTCVTHIMQAFEHCHLGDEHRFSQLCGLIKKDEAKHVYVSRKHALALGATLEQFSYQHEYVLRDLMKLLQTQGDAFESMGVCLDRLNQKLETKWR
ncbi:hypothetical protein JK628_17435 [Shewanella sp. KX20019]|uniref:hypothetical protein n=1 Tax=Shewanella sp. KX20019 TaxID=2803864 RepID=UPI0019269441|nr:hypothetical protein [Shewanella sp. KX20019]QQX79305.1 hypothetical protein JK628_17435 [Shewanella sp. KX20019]